MANKLVLFTSEFPFGSSESFLETEVKYLAAAFDEVQIITVEPSNQIQRSLPENCSAKLIYVKVSLMGKALALFYLFHPLFWRELELLRKIYKKKINLNVISSMLVSLYRANRIKKYSESIVLNTLPSTKLFFYSYWCDDSALSLAFIQRKFPKVACFSRLHAWDVYFEVSESNYLPFRHYIADNLKAIFAISENGKHYCKEFWKINCPDKIRISRLGVTAQSKISTSEEFILVSCSSVIPIKRVDLIVYALSTLNGLAIRWVHFGEGSELEHVKEIAKKLPNTIQWELKGRLTNDEVLKWYACHRPALFINASFSEGIPVSIMEAMSFGIPVIATHVGASGEIVNQENGLLLPPDPTTEEIAFAIKTFYYLSKEQKNAKAENAWKTWDEKYNAKKNYSNFIKQIKDLQ